MDINIFVNAISAIGVITSVFYLARQVKVASKVHGENHDWNRRIETKHALDSYNRLEAVMLLNEAFDYMGERHAIDKDIILNKLVEEPQVRVHLMRLLNFYEGLANGIDMGLYEEIIVREARRGNMIRTHTAFKEFMNYHRAEVNELAFIKYRALVEKWEKEGKEGVKLNKLGL
jgi:DNA-binding transcriptional ArsR family regulator